MEQKDLNCRFVLFYRNGDRGCNLIRELVARDMDASDISEKDVDMIPNVRTDPQYWFLRGVPTLIDWKTQSFVKGRQAYNHLMAFIAESKEVQPVSSIYAQMGTDRTVTDDDFSTAFSEDAPSHVLGQTYDRPVPVSTAAILADTIPQGKKGFGTVAEEYMRRRAEQDASIKRHWEKTQGKAPEIDAARQKEVADSFRKPTGSTPTTQMTGDSPRPPSARRGPGGNAGIAQQSGQTPYAGGYGGMGHQGYNGGPSQNPQEGARRGEAILQQHRQMTY
jgi:hypothetical protein